MVDIFISTKSPYKTIKYLNRLNINIYNINYQNDGIKLRIALKDVNKVDKYYNFKIIKEYGNKELINYFRINIVPIIYFVSILVLIFLFTRITLSIEVVSENTKLRNHILNELYKVGPCFMKENNSWIIDGNYRRIAKDRFNNADIIIFLAYNRFTCLNGVIKRYKKYKGRR